MFAASFARFVLIVVLLSLALPGGAQTDGSLAIMYHWTRDFTTSPVTQVCSTGGPVHSAGKLHVRFKPPTGFTQNAIKEIKVHEQVGDLPDAVYTNVGGWNSSPCSVCGDPVNAGFLFIDTPVFPYPMQAHNGLYDITVTVRSGRMSPTTHAYETREFTQTFSIDVQNVVITGTAPANPDVLFWNPETMTSLPIAYAGSAGYKSAATATCQIYKSDQTLVRTLTQLVHTDGGGAVFLWDGKGEAGSNGSQTQEKGLYLFRFQVQSLSLNWDYDTDKSPHLSITQTRSDLTDDYNETTEENTTKDACVLVCNTTPTLNAAEANVGVYGMELNLITGPKTLPVTATTYNAASPVWNEATFPLKIDEVETHLFNARDNHAAKDKGHRTRWALQNNQHRVRPVADCFGSVFPEATQASKMAQILLESMHYKATDQGNKTATFMLQRLPKDRVFFYVGGGPADAFNNGEEPDEEELYGGVTGANKTVLMGCPSEKVPSSMKYPGNFSFMDTLPSGALLQTKLTVWLACLTARSGSAAFNTSTVTNKSLAKGDSNTSCSVGFLDLISVHGYPPWTRVFFERLRVGQSVLLATSEARKAAAAVNATGYDSVRVEGRAGTSIRL